MNQPTKHHRLAQLARDELERQLRQAEREHKFGDFGVVVSIRAGSIEEVQIIEKDRRR